MNTNKIQSNEQYPIVNIVRCFVFSSQLEITVHRTAYAPYSTDGTLLFHSTGNSLLKTHKYSTWYIIKCRAHVSQTSYGRCCCFCHCVLRFRFDVLLYMLRIHCHSMSRQHTIRSFECLFVNLLPFILRRHCSIIRLSYVQCHSDKKSIKIRFRMRIRPLDPLKYLRWAPMNVVSK